MHVDQRGEGLGSDETKMPAWIPCFICTRPRMAPKLWRESYSAKGMHALIDYHRSDIPYYHQMSSACVYMYQDIEFPSHRAVSVCGQKQIYDIDIIDIS